MKEKKMTNPELIYLCRQLSMLLKAGISLLEGISILRDDADTKDGQKILSVIYDELLETGDIQSALEKPKFFLPIFVHMVKMGELSGNLDDTFASLAAHYEAGRGPDRQHPGRSDLSSDHAGHALLRSSLC
ncbi:MAG: type II secretion system F family protein [Lachnospiraceae bacterium]